ncbi:MAG: UDP-2,3-diacylglucosamine diphosphatase [Pseudomonadota bacterium]
MSTTLFISDLHIDEKQPEIAAQFFQFARGEARQADALYILGDLFEAWVGDDDTDAYLANAQNEIAALTRHIPVFVMHGNRDFLLGAAFAERTGVQLIDDPVVIELHGTRVLLAHGDAYCTDDHDYMAVRAQMRNPAWQAQILSLPLEARRQLAGQARAESTSANAGKDMQIMDVNQQAIETALIDHEVTDILHGHTHRPDVHHFTLADGRKARRMVLGDWYEHGSVGVWNAAGFKLEQRPRALA